MIQIRRFHADEGALLKETRLRALRDSPAAFSASYEHELVKDSQYWDRLVQGAGEFQGSQSFMAIGSGEVLAMAGCYPETGDRYRLVAMWVERSVRRSGIGHRVLNAVEAWVRSNDAHELVVAVYPSNSEGLGFYLRKGFSRETQHSGGGHASGSVEIQLAKRLPG